MPEHFILRARDNPDGCVLDSFPSTYEPLWQPTEGVPVGALHPPTPPDFEMSRRLGGKAVSDCLDNTLGYLLVSERLRAVLEAHATAAIEFLPIHLVNHKKRREPRAFFIANVLGHVPCADRARSQFMESSLRKERFCDLTRLFLDPGRVDLRRNIFRLAELPRVILVDETLARAVRDSGVTGVDLLPQGTEVSL